MTLEEKINADIKNAMLAREKDKLEALRAVKSAILLAKTEKAGGELSEDSEVKLLQKLVKQRKESAEIYTSQNRADLAENELFQAGIIEQYLPQQLTSEEIREILKGIIQETGAESARDMGKVMGIASQRMAGKADGKTISGLLKELLT